MQLGTGSVGYSNYKVQPRQWYRFIISVKNVEFFRYYLDDQFIMEGEKHDVDGRYGLEKTVLFFADNDGEFDIADIAFGATRWRTQRWSNSAVMCMRARK